MISRMHAARPWKSASAVAYALSFPLYLAIQWHGQHKAVVIPWTNFELAIPVIPALLPIYLIQLVAVTLPFIFIASCRAWLRAVTGLWAVSATCMAIHWFVPTCTSAWPHPVGSALAWLNSIDGKGNVCPSLHTACAFGLPVAASAYRD